MAGENGNGNGNGNGNHAALVLEVVQGRPTLWRDEMLEEIDQLASLGFKKHEIAKSLGVSRDCFMEWQRIRPEIAETIDRAKIRGAKVCAMRIMKAAEDPRFWTAAAWFLERTLPESFGLKQHLQVEHTNAITTAAIEEAEAKLKIM
jgi:hypothetical protein